MSLFPQAFSLIFRLEFFNKCRAACTVLGIGSVLIEKIKVVLQSLQTITSSVSPNSFLFSFYKICKLSDGLNRNLEYGCVILFPDL